MRWHWQWYDFGDMECCCCGSKWPKRVGSQDWVHGIRWTSQFMHGTSGEMKDEYLLPLWYLLPSHADIDEFRSSPLELRHHVIMLNSQQGSSAVHPSLPLPTSPTIARASLSCASSLTKVFQTVRIGTCSSLFHLGGTHISNSDRTSAPVRATSNVQSILVT